MSRAMTDAFIRNLKLLNAKERDHLMRFAYLGQSDDYKTASTFLSPSFDKLLHEHAVGLGLDASAECVFAGMDYHLDWLFAALWTARKLRAIDSPDQDPLLVRMEPSETVKGINALYTEFRSVSGSQEDVDLLAVYDDGSKLAVLFIEAKGSASFDKVQLARKLIRLDRIIVNPELGLQDDSMMSFGLILAAPKEPRFKCCLKHARDLPVDKSGEDKFVAMREALKEHRSGIGSGLNFLKLTGFPKPTYAVERKSEAGAQSEAGSYTHWTLRERK